MVNVQCQLDSPQMDDLTDAIALWNRVVDEKAEDWWWTDGYWLEPDMFGDSNSGLPFTPAGFISMRSGGSMVGLALVRSSHPEQDAQGRQNVAWLYGVVVAASHRRRGVGTQLLQEVESRAASAGMAGIYLEGRVMSGMAAYGFLLARGYRPGNAEMVLKLNIPALRANKRVGDLISRLEQNGIRFRQYRPLDFDALRAFIQQTVPAWWPRYEREVRDGAMDSVLLACCADRIVGAMEVKVWRARGTTVTGGGPVVDPEFRRKGIATVLMQAWGERVQALGAQQSVISTGLQPDNPAVGLYLALGYKRIGEYGEEWSKDLQLPQVKQ